MRFLEKIFLERSQDKCDRLCKGDELKTCACFRWAKGVYLDRSIQNTMKRFPKTLAYLAKN